MLGTRCLAALAACAFTAGATAGDYDPANDLVYDLGAFTLLGVPVGDPAPEVLFDLVIPAGPDVVGFSFAGNYIFEQNDTSWASDTRMVMSDFADYSIGGLTNLVNPWMGTNFPQGSGSDDLGAYETGPLLPWLGAPIDGSGGGTLRLAFNNDWFTASAHDIGWGDVSVTIHRVPAPGVATLLATAGLLAPRRRRR